MFIHPGLVLDLAHDKTAGLIAEAERARALRPQPKARRTRTVRGRPAGTLGSCEPSAVVPAR